MDNILNNINDILDSKGKYNNFLTNKPYSDQYIEMAKKWSELPLYNTKEAVSDFFNLLHNKQVILLVSGTGSGKTVIVPKIVKSNVPLKTVTGEADIKRYDHNIRPTFSTRPIDIARTTVSSTVSASDIDDVSIDDRTMVLEIVVEELDSRMVEKKNAEALYGNGASFEAIIPTLDSTFIEKSKVENLKSIFNFLI